MIVRVKNGWVIKSEDGKKTLSKVFRSKSMAKRRLVQIEYFKDKKNT